MARLLVASSDRHWSWPVALLDYQRRYGEAGTVAEGIHCGNLVARGVVDNRRQFAERVSGLIDAVEGVVSEAGSVAERVHRGDGVAHMVVDDGGQAGSRWRG